MSIRAGTPLGATSVSRFPGRDDAVERLPGGGGVVPVVLTVEHASNRLPEPWRWPEADSRLVNTHWAIDLGIADFARALSAALGAPAVLARFSRLLVDANRPQGSPTLFRDVADGEPVHLNRNLGESERARRVEGFWRPYHEAVDVMVAEHPGADVLGLHSYTPSYEGQVREVEIGVLYDRDVELGLAWAEQLHGRGFDVRLNEPWSGLAGLMYSPQTHALRHGRRAVELEIRQDLLLDPARAAQVLTLVAEAATRLHL